MSKFELDVWTTREFSKTWTHVIKGSFADPQFDTQSATDLFCYDRNAGIGAFFATVKNGRLDNGTLVQDGPRQVGPNHTFSSRWTHIVNVAAGQVSLFFYDADSGVGEFYATDGHGNLTLKKRHSGLPTSWTLIVPGRFGRKTIVTSPFQPPITRQKAHLLCYDPTKSTGEFYSVDESGNIHLERKVTGWLKTWHSIIAGNFSNGEFDDLLFYDKTRGVGVFYKTDANIGRTLLSEHVNWRTTWQHILSGQFLENAPFDGLLFYDDAGHTEFHSTDGQGMLSKIDVNPGNEWNLPFQVILVGEFTPNMGVLNTENLCGYDPKDGVVRYFFFARSTIKTVIDLNGRWTDGSTRSAVISSAFTSLTVDMSAFHRAAAHGSIIDGSTMTVTFPDDATHTAKLQLPNTMKWSNGSVWRKV